MGNVVCGCFCGSTPEPVPVTVYNNAYTLVLGTDASTKWIDLSFTLATSFAGTGFKFVLATVDEAYEVVDPTELFVVIDNVVQETSTYTLDAATRGFITLNTALADGSTLRVRALVNTTEL